MFRKFILITLTLLTAMTVCASLYMQVKSEAAAKHLPVLAQVQGFNLTNQEGAPFSAEDVKGKVWVASFVFTSCSGPCPLLTSHVAQLAKENAAKDGVRFVSISVDPETDTPAVLKQYGQKFNADFNRWNFLTGKRDDIAALMKDQFKLGYAQDIMFHSDRLALVDQLGQIRGYYTGSEVDAFKNLQRDLAALTNQK